MLLYNDRQLMVVCLLVCCCIAAAFRASSIREDTIRQAPRKGFVYELRGDSITEGFYCFSSAQTAAGLARACGARVQDMQTDAGGAGFVKNGSRVLFGSTVSIEEMSPRARLNFFLPLSVNTASAEDLTLIRGLGKKTACAIIMYREQHKGIRSVAELRSVEGIGVKKLTYLKRHLTE